jgi:hypothetical protein
MLKHKQKQATWIQQAIFYSVSKFGVHIYINNKDTGFQNLIVRKIQQSLKTMQLQGIKA